MRTDPRITLPDNRQGIALTTDVDTDKPLAWLVFLHNTNMAEYVVYDYEEDAVRCAEDQAEQAGSDWVIYPLYPADPVSLYSSPRL